MAKYWSDLSNFYRIVICLEFLSKKIFFIFLGKIELLMFHNNTVKNSEKMNKQNLLKICLQVIYPTDFCIMCIDFYYGKK